MEQSIQNQLKPKVIDIIMSNEEWKQELYILMKSPEWGEAVFNDWIKDKVAELKSRSSQTQL